MLVSPRNTNVFFFVTGILFCSILAGKIMRAEKERERERERGERETREREVGRETRER